jgi:4-azaleucine resistance transporter AzlC
MTKNHAMFWAGARAEVPIMLGGVPFGLIYGVLALGAGISPLLTQLMSCIVFAGSAQFVTAQLVGAGAPGLAIIVTATIVNLRHALYSASVAPYLRPLRPIWRIGLAYLLTDEAYAVAIMRYQDDEGNPANHWYFLGAGLALWVSWQLSTAAGILLGAQIPAEWGLDFTLPLTFIALVVPALADRAVGLAALTGGIVAVVASGLPYQLGLILAAIVGIIVGLLAERWLPTRRAQPAGHRSPATDQGENV